VNPVLRFVDAVNRGDIEAVASAFHPDFEMIVPQHPARGFKGRDQEVKNMEHLITTHPEGRITVRRMVEAPNEVWAQNTFTADGLTIEAVVIFEIDPETDTIRSGHYYSEAVDEGGPEISEWIEGLGRT
jgi:hypothetical protein